MTAVEYDVIIFADMGERSRWFGEADKAPDTPPIYEGILSPEERRGMARFVADFVGYGPTSAMFRSARTTFLARPVHGVEVTYGRLSEAAEAARMRAGLPINVQLSKDDSRILVKAMTDDEDFIKACAFQPPQHMKDVIQDCLDAGISADELPTASTVANFERLREKITEQNAWFHLQPPGSI